VEEVGRDGVVAVAGAGGVVLFALLQGHEEVVGAGRLMPEDAGCCVSGLETVERPRAARRVLFV
jgi:hypothetical protein